MSPAYANKQQSYSGSGLVDTEKGSEEGCFFVTSVSVLLNETKTGHVRQNGWLDVPGEAEHTPPSDLPRITHRLLCMERLCNHSRRKASILCCRSLVLDPAFLAVVAKAKPAATVALLGKAKSNDGTDQSLMRTKNGKQLM